MSMTRTHKTRVAVLRGGPSHTYETSLKTGDTVLKHLPHTYEVIDVFISTEGIWHVHGIEKKPSDALKHIDVAFIALHGEFGEDGKVQRILEHLGIPFTGSKAFESALATHKHHTKELLKKLGIKVKTPVHKLVTKADVELRGLHALFRELPHPSVVKPVTGSHKIGVTVVRDFLALTQALEEAFRHSESVIVEELIEGREVACAVIDEFRGEKHYSLLPVDVKLSGHTGVFDETTKKALEDTARGVHAHLGLRHYSLSDFIVHPKRGIYFVEVNTLPVLTPEALLPQALRQVGVNLGDFLSHVIALAQAKK